MKARIGIVFATALVLFVVGCDYSVKSTQRLRLPQGNAENGKTAFVALKCTECHTVAGVELPKPTAPAETIVALGGDVERVRTIGDLLTSIIHPNYAISEKMKRPAGGERVKSPMRDVNDVMTVTQMVDLVAFLQPRYTYIPRAVDWSYAF